ncbi:helix-turn-helix transcriptional regulator [Actinorugispora endophytica]|uniref:Putative DNA-binding transcriptional regulator YafY n=1 Tax=Actinorugispora endophytica TaxID=1605990 RepID=A0A4R6UXF1_9ACTN|nr:YafY family protein [Actinorugispora endophytica]TDQ50245.1 putative DNA-binding transcriptional regulator YafY [Actinorugispora endophytica]
MRASRLLSLLLLLQNRGRLTAAQLAAELEVSERTIYRDVESLGAAGIPIYADRGAGGGYRLLAGYRTRLTGLTDGEADSVFLSAVPHAAAELGLGAEMAAANLKILAAMPESLRDRAERVRGRFHLDAPAWFREPDHAPHLTAIASAVWEERVVTIRYRRWNSTPLERTLAPLGLVLKSGLWYLVALPHPAAPGRGPRTFRASRVDELTDTGERFTRPDDFDLADYWDDWSRDFEAGLYTGTARVRLSARGRELMRAVSPPALWASLDAAEPCADGRFETELPYESLDQAVSAFSQCGPELEVLEPVELRGRVLAAARATVLRYEG